MKHILKFNEVNLFRDDQWDFDEEEDFSRCPNRFSDMDFDEQVDRLVEKHKGRNYLDILKDFALNDDFDGGVVFTIEDFDDNSFLQLYNGEIIGKVSYFENNDANPYSIDAKQRYKQVIEVCQAEEVRNENGGGEIDYDNIRLIPFDTFRNFITQIHTTYLTFLTDNMVW